MAKRRKSKAAPAKSSGNMMAKVGAWAFIVGVILALVSGFWALNPTWTSVLIVLGLLVGFLNITGKEVNQFLFAGLVLVVMASLGGTVLSRIAVVGPALQNIFSALVVFVVPATLVVALKAIYSVAHDD